MLTQVKTYYQLTKPGIIYGNLLTATAGFFLAASLKGFLDVWLLLATLVGTSFVIGSACVFNNYIDKDIDQVMARTKIRALVTGSISNVNAIIFATILGLAGFFILGSYTNSVTVFVGLIGFFVYVVIYGISKRRSVHGTLIGSVAGATPIVAGYVAVTNQFDLASLILFLILLFWQMPHFYAVAIYRFDDYKNAKIPLLPIVQSVVVAKFHILFYTIAFVLATISLTVFGYTHFIYLGTMALLGIAWLWFCVQGFSSKNDKRWARKMFLFSLIIILVFSIALSVGAILP